MRLISFICLLATVLPASAEDYAFTGYARDLDTDALLYVETHAIQAAGTTDERRTVLYRRNETDEPFARKTLSYGADRARPSFRFADERSGFVESVASVAGGFEVRSRAGAAATARTAVIPSTAVTVIDAGFDEFVRANWDELKRGDGLTAPFLVPSRLDAVRFRIRKVRDTRIDGAASTVIRLSLAGPLGWVLPDIDVTYRDEDRRLMRYHGLTNIRDEAGQLISARIDFPDPRR
jgi:hypothetical protein